MENEEVSKATSEDDENVGKQEADQEDPQDVGSGDMKASMTTDSEANASGGPRKRKGRKRKKALHAALLKQMEFYFSDANLSKDRFMINTLKTNTEIPLEIFLTFNKIKSLSEDVRDLAKALKFSTLLKLSEDETKVSRVEPFKPRPQDQVDQCTVYVEQLPPAANIEWVTKAFAGFGPVAYVSLPKFNDQRNKGFAFVEFSTAESADKAVKAYDSTKTYSALLKDPGQLTSIQSFNAESHQESTVGSQDAGQKQEDQHASNDNEENGEPKAKKLKVDTEGKDDTGETEVADELSMKKGHVEFKEEVEYGAPTAPLQVISKKDWKKLRNLYLNLQRKNFRQLRMNSLKGKHRQQASEADQHGDQECNEEKPEEPCPAVETPTSTAEPFQTGVIVKITLEEPISDDKRFKNQVKVQDGVAYVEAEAFSSVAFIRCTDAAAAKTLVDKNIWSRSEILQGDEEQSYWLKIEENRVKKREKSGRSRKSGAERAIKKKFDVEGDANQPCGVPAAPANKNSHVRFDEEDD